MKMKSVSNVTMAIVLAALGGILAAHPSRADGTEFQHQDWGRKFHTPGGSTKGGAIEEVADMRMEVDVQRPLRCETHRQHVGADMPPLDGC